MRKNDNSKSSNCSILLLHHLNLHPPAYPCRFALLLGFRFNDLPSMNMAQTQEKSPPRKKPKKTTNISSCFTACFRFCDDEERPLKLRKLTPKEERHNKNTGFCVSWSKLRIQKSTTKGLVVKGTQATDVESEKAEAQRRYDKKKKTSQKLHEIIRSKIPNQQSLMRHQNFIPTPATPSPFSEDQQVTTMIICFQY